MQEDMQQRQGPIHTSSFYWQQHKRAPLSLLRERERNLSELRPPLTHRVKGVEYPEVKGDVPEGSPAQLELLSFLIPLINRWVSLLSYCLHLVAHYLQIEIELVV